MSTETVYKRKMLFGILVMTVGLLAALVVANIRSKEERRCTAETYGTATTVFVHDSNEGRSYDVTVKYEIDGKEYTYTAVSQHEIREGESLKVMYDPDDHSVFYIPSARSSPMMMRIGGGIFAAAGLIMAAVNYYKMRKLRSA